jgi:hypothetical protein
MLALLRITGLFEVSRRKELISLCEGRKSWRWTMCHCWLAARGNDPPHSMHLAKFPARLVFRLETCNYYYYYKFPAVQFLVQAH